MDCRSFETLIVGTRGRDRTDSQRAAMADHAAHCARCADLAACMRRIEGALDALPRDPAPDALSDGIMARVRQSAPQPAHWHQRWLGALRPPAPALSLSHAMAAAALVVMLASVGALAWHHRSAAPASPATVAIATRAGGPVIEVDRQFVDSLVARHQAAAALQPLSDDESMRLVSY